MPAIRTRTEDWRDGETVVGWVFLFGFIPFARHHLHVAAIDESTRTLSSQEHGGVITTWNHDIIITPLDETTCEYRDRIEIDAGNLTWLVGLYARGFYAMRQRRWREVAKEL